jgi:type I restriction enzyme S subunit
LKHVARISNGSTPSRENLAYWIDGSFPWLNSSVVNQARVTEGSDFVTDLALRECHLPLLSPPAVVVGITGEGKTRGMATLVEIKCTINQHLAFIKPKNGSAGAAYIRHLFLPLYDFLRRESSGGGSTKGAITCEQLANLKVPCPPIQEQVEIVERISRQASQTDTLVAKVERSIDLLREHRAALISAAVTGKIDVRGEVHQ